MENETETVSEATGDYHPATDQQTERVTRAEVAEELGCKINTLAGWVKSGYFDVPHEIRNNLYVYKRRDVDAWVETAHRNVSGKVAQPKSHNAKRN